MVEVAVSLLGRDAAGEIFFCRAIMRKTIAIWLTVVLALVSLTIRLLAAEQPALSPLPPSNIHSVESTAFQPEPPGDRVKCTVRNVMEWMPAVVSKDVYKVAPGDVLSVIVSGKANLNYVARPDAGQGTSPDEITVSPAGDIYLPLVGKISVVGKTVPEIEDSIRTRLCEYIREFQVSVAISKIHTVNVWITGEVENPGPQMLPAVASVSLAALQADIKPTGSTRRIVLTRKGVRYTVDLYKMSITGDIEGDMPLEPGDVIHVPAVSEYVEISGEVVRPGKYEMVSKSGSSDMTVHDLVELALGLTPAAMKERGFIERISEGGTKEAVYVNLADPNDNPHLQVGDRLVVPSISSYQPMIWLVGEFTGEGVYQRTPGSTVVDIENKSGIYFLKQGQTVLDVISATGGVTPQADLKRARIERRENGVLQSIPVDLERLLIRGDKTADVVLKNGDSIILPAVANKVHIFGEVRQPGSFVYSPNRRLVDYLGDAGGPTEQSKLTDVSIVRVSEGSKPTIVKLNAKAAIRGQSAEGNPILEPGDIVYVPSKFISSWRDATQMIFTSLSLITLFRRL